MKMFQLSVAAVFLMLPLATLATPVEAATAHNSQAGANGPTSNPAAPTGRHMKRMKHKKAM